MATHSSIVASKIPWTAEPGTLYIVHGVEKSWTGLSIHANKNVGRPVTKRRLKPRELLWTEDLEVNSTYGRTMLISITICFKMHIDLKKHHFQTERIVMTIILFNYLEKKLKILLNSLDTSIRKVKCSINYINFLVIAFPCINSLSSVTYKS